MSVPAAKPNALELELQLKQVQLAELIAAISERNHEIESCNRDLKMTRFVTRSQSSIYWSRSPIIELQIDYPEP